MVRDSSTKIRAYARIQQSSRHLNHGKQPDSAHEDRTEAINTPAFTDPRNTLGFWPRPQDPRARADPPEQQASQPLETAGFRSRRPGRKRSTRLLALIRALRADSAARIDSPRPAR
jgi:hypothetical protein